MAIAPVAHPNAQIREAGQSFVLGFVVRAVFSDMNTVEGLVGGALSAAASLIDTITRPIIALCFDANFHGSRLELLTRTLVVLTFLGAAAACFPPVLGLPAGIDTTTLILARLAVGILIGRGTFDNHVYIV